MKDVDDLYVVQCTGERRVLGGNELRKAFIESVFKEG